MLNVTPLLSINLSMQTSWGPELWPWTTLVSSPEAGRACLLAQPPHGVSQICTLKTKHMQKIFSAYLNKHTQIYTRQRLDTCKAKLKKKYVNSYLRNTNLQTHTDIGIHMPAWNPACPSCHWKIVLHSTEGVMGCYQQDHSMDGCPNWE